MRTPLLWVLLLGTGCWLHGQDLKLPSRDQHRASPVLSALEKRKSSKAFTSQRLTELQLSEMLWAANGLNRTNGGRTTPSALSRYPVDVYVVLPEGVYKFLPAQHTLKLVTAGDHRVAAASQDYAAKAPVNLVYVTDLDRFKDRSSGQSPGPAGDLLVWGAFEAGCISQSVSVYCAEQNLGSVVRVSINKGEFARVAGLTAGQTIVAAQSIGFAAAP